MSATLKKIILSNKPDITFGDPHIFQMDVIPMLTIEKDDSTLHLLLNIRSGFKCDGASIPWCFRWFLPKWAVEKNPTGEISSEDIYNIGSAIHDGLYIHKGFGIFSREECDDILRGIWRESGISRFKAGVADKCVEWFAGGSKHWGNDSYGVADLIYVEYEKWL